MSEYLLLLLSTALVNNVVLVKFLGLCPFMGVSNKLETALGMGMATTFVLTLAAIASWLIEHYILIPFDIGFLRIISFILVIAAVVQLTEMIVRMAVGAPLEALHFETRAHGVAARTGDEAHGGLRGESGQTGGQVEPIAVERAFRRDLERRAVEVVTQVDVPGIEGNRPARAAARPGQPGLQVGGALDLEVRCRDPGQGERKA